ncbi:hypothetical protein [Paenibacillus polymyxa]|uniref:hypothetical protein n=1 Tax=Paenibacillus polymyxa TaxID=1406 RepID=UPI002378D265|nr:hypothetical protein [Paenibacillus polymyxa]WDM22897.1 hypothetical protein J4I02_04685 [Paenibacillus polymyxa]
MIKKRQYHLWQYQLGNVREQNGEFSLVYTLTDAKQASETFMYYILHEKIMNKQFDATPEYITNQDTTDPKSNNSKPIRKKKNILPIMTIETGRGRSQEDNDKLKRLLEKGFTAIYSNTNGQEIARHTYVFLDNVLSGAQNKECRQLFVLEKYDEALKAHVSLGTEPTQCTVSKNLTRNALMTTDVYLCPVDMKQLTICILPDKEIPVTEDVEMILPYHRTPEEEGKYVKLQAYMEEEKHYEKQRQKISQKVKDHKIELPIAPNDREQYKTTGRWERENNRRVCLEHLTKPAWKVEKKDGVSVPVWTINQTEPYEKKELPIAPWSTGLQLAEVKSHTVMENVFDGMGLVSKELGQQMERFLQVDYTITGYQLRLPTIKGFFPCVDFHGYFRKHNVKRIQDIFGTWHDADKIDILTTESTFKAKLQVIGEKPDGLEEKAWLFPSIAVYQSKLIEYGYDAIGISNVAKPVHEQYRKSSYQLLLALDLQARDVVCLSHVQGDLIYRALSIYRKEELDWEGLRYLQAFLHLVYRENSDNGIGKQCSDAIHALQLNKKLAFDHKVRQTIKEVIDHKIDEMGLGKFYIEAKYLYVTQDILAFLSYAAAADHHTWEYTGFLSAKQSYCGGAILGQNLFARNPIMSFSEITRTTFVDYEGEDAEFIRHIDNIVQLPLGTEPDRLGGADRDGDELLVLSTELNLVETQIEYLQQYNFKVNNEKSEHHGKNRLDLLNENIQQHFAERFPAQAKVSVADYVIDSLVQVNDADKSTAPSQDWNKANVIDFIIRSEDKTGEITDINTTIENIANAKGRLLQYKFPIAIMKHLQALCIDASKSGLFDQVVIPDVIQYRFGTLKPQFTFFKDGKTYNKYRQYISALDLLAESMFSFKKYINRIMIDDTDRKIRKHQFENIYQYFQNPDLDTVYVDQTINALKTTYDTFLQINRELTQEKQSLNPFASDEKQKRLRKEVDAKFAELYRETKAAAESICDCPSLLATAAVRKTYVDSKAKKSNKNYSFCWVVASEGMLQNVQLHYEDKDKVYIQQAKESDEHTFEWLGHNYATVMKREAYTLQWPEGKDMSIPDKYLKRQDAKLGDLIDYKISLVSSEKRTWNPKEVAEKMVGQTYTLFDDRGWLGVAEGLSIARKVGDSILNCYMYKSITIKQIIKTTNASIIFQADFRA